MNDTVVGPRALDARREMLALKVRGNMALNAYRKALHLNDHAAIATWEQELDAVDAALAELEHRVFDLAPDEISRLTRVFAQLSYSMDRAQDAFNAFMQWLPQRQSSRSRRKW